MLIKCSLRRRDGQVEVVIVKSWIDDRMTMHFEIRRLHSSGNRVPTVKEKNRCHR